MTDEQLQQCLGFWQEKLGLRDWKISARMASSQETAGKIGQSSVHVRSKLATIFVARQQALDLTSEYYQAFPEECRPEATLIHELLHVVLEGVIAEDPDEHEEIMQEQAIESLSRALYELSQ